MRCSDCGRDTLDPLAPIGSECARRGGHEARCTCRPHYHGSGLIFPLPKGAQPGSYAGRALSHDCPIHAPLYQRHRAGCSSLGEHAPCDCGAA